GLQKALVRMLTVDVDELVAELPQLRERCRHAIDIRFAAAPLIDHAPQENGVGVEFTLFEPAAKVSRRLEGGRDVGTVGSFTHDSGVRASAEREGKSIYQYGFTCAGLARENRETGPKLDFGTVDD